MGANTEVVSSLGDFLAYGFVHAWLVGYAQVYSFIKRHDIWSWTFQNTGKNTKTVSLNYMA